MEEDNQPKLCPFLNQPCIGELCALSMGINQVVLGVRRTMTTCALPALALIMSGISQQQAQQGQRIQLPNVRRQ